MELCTSFDISSAECCHRERVVLEMKKGSIILTPLTCHMCHVSFGLSFFYAPHVDKLHNPSHLIQVHVLSCLHVDESNASAALQLQHQCCRHCLNLWAL